MDVSCETLATFWSVSLRTEDHQTERRIWRLPVLCQVPQVQAFPHDRSACFCANVRMGSDPRLSCQAIALFKVRHKGDLDSRPATASAWHSKKPTLTSKPARRLLRELRLPSPSWLAGAGGHDFNAHCSTVSCGAPVAGANLRTHSHCIVLHQLSANSELIRSPSRAASSESCSIGPNDWRLVMQNPNTSPGTGTTGAARFGATDRDGAF
jgi:hypothetical protein